MSETAEKKPKLNFVNVNFVIRKLTYIKVTMEVSCGRTWCGMWFSWKFQNLSLSMQRPNTIFS